MVTDEIRVRSMWQLRSLEREFKVQVLALGDNRVELFFPDGSREWMNRDDFLARYKLYAWIHPAHRPA